MTLLMLSTQLIPNSINWYTGEACEFDEEEDEDDDEDDDDEDEDEEDDDEAPGLVQEGGGAFKSNGPDSDAKPECKQN